MPCVGTVYSLSPYTSQSPVDKRVRIKTYFSVLAKLSVCYLVLDCAHMASDDSGIAKSTTMTVRLKPEISKKLDALARNTQRSKSYLAGEAITSFVDVNTWQVTRIKQALDDAHSDAPGIPHRQVVEWMNSWGTNHELPRPAPKKKSR